jgi:TonB family protein
MTRKLLARWSGYFNVATLPLMLICGRDPDPQHRPSAPAIQLPHSQPGVKPLNEPLPKYPLEARQKHWEGSGLVELRLARDGSVTDTTILQSTGHSLLDTGATGALRRWRFRPSGGVDRVRIPITFSCHCTH